MGERKQRLIALTGAALLAVVGRDCYFTSAGFRVEHYETRRFAYSWNPNARVVLVDGFRA